MTEQESKQHIQSGTWLVEEADKLIEQYKNCKTAHESCRLISQMEHLVSRMSFESREIEKTQQI